MKSSSASSSATPPAHAPDAPPSPCINVCRMDAHSGLCSGCGRTIEEIVAWAAADGEQKREILANIMQRHYK